MARKGLEGVDYVARVDGEPGSLTKTGKRAFRKPTDEELAAQWAACERSWDAAISAVGDGWLRSSWGEGFKFTYQHALLAEIESRGSKPAKRSGGQRITRKRQEAPKAKPKSRTRESHRRDDLFRMYRPELEAIGTPEALAEIARREAKRAAKVADRKVAVNG